jgi:voltage-gated potassium channel
VPHVLQTADPWPSRLTRMTPEIETDPKIRRLGEVELFRGCSDPELAEIARISQARDLPPGTLLCRQGRPSPDCIVVVEGIASVEVGGELVGSVGPGETIGEMAMLTRSLRSATVKTSTPMKVYVIDGARFEEVLRRRPEVPIAMLRRAASMLQQVFVMAGRPEAA